MTNSEARITKQALKNSTGRWEFDYTRVKGYKYWDGTPAEHDYLMVMADGPTIIDTKATNSISAEVVTDWFSTLGKRHGVPQTLVVDNGPQFHSHAMTNVMAELGVTIEYTPLFQPRFKGTVERYIRKLVVEKFDLRSSGEYE